MDWKKKLATELEVNHRFANGCWQTDYVKIAGLKLLATSCNGTSGIGIYRGLGKVHWFRTVDGYWDINPY